MNQLDILLPFGLPPAELARDLMRELATPGLAALISRAHAASGLSFDPVAHALPHELWLARQARLLTRLDQNPSLPLALGVMRELGIAPTPGVWFVLHPAHVQLTREHGLLCDRRGLGLSDAEARALFNAAQPYFDETGKTLLYGSADTWFLRADDWRDLQTASPDAACGESLHLWQAHGTGERSLRKLHNEVQMLWHLDPVNRAREARGEKPVNAFWPWGGAVAEQAEPAEPAPAHGEYDIFFNASSLFSLFAGSAAPSANAANAANADSAAIAASQAQRGLLLLDALIAPALANEWRQWLDQFHALEQAWLAPLLAALKTGKIGQIRLIMSRRDALAEFASHRLSQARFWRKPSLDRLDKLNKLQKLQECEPPAP